MKYILRGVLFLSLVLWCLGFSSSLYANEGYAAFSGLLLSHFYSPVCHQLPYKCIAAESGSFLVCARCTGIYTGALVVSLISLFKKEIKIQYIMPAFVLLFADVLFAATGLYTYSKTAALFTGLLAGFALFPYILNILEKTFTVNETK
jgi:uncharacterized membrane protein